MRHFVQKLFDKDNAHYYQSLAARVCTMKTHLIGYPSWQDKPVLSTWNCPLWSGQGMHFTKFLDNIGDWVYVNMNDSRGFMVLQTKLAFPALETKMTFFTHNKRNLFVPKNTSFIDQACSVKVAGYKVHFFFFFWRFHGPRRSWGPLKKKKKR